MQVHQVVNRDIYAAAVGAKVRDPDKTMIVVECEVEAYQVGHQIAMKVIDPTVSWVGLPEIVDPGVSLSFVLGSVLQGITPHQGGQ
jgi:hypothetical protein